VVTLEVVVRLVQAANDLATYRAHDRNCEIEQTDFCTCGLREAAYRYAAATKKVREVKEW
jgi:hypothetical protein